MHPAPPAIHMYTMMDTTAVKRTERRYMDLLETAVMDLSFHLLASVVMTMSKFLAGNHHVRIMNLEKVT